MVVPTRQPRPAAKVLSFAKKTTQIFSEEAGDYLDGDIVIAYHANQGLGDYLWCAPIREPLSHIDGRPC